jgi:hypothetical protein
MRTRAAVLRKGGEPWEITELDLDEPQAGEVLIRYEAAGLCHSDEHIRATGTARLPLVGGHEGAGVIEKTGPAVTRVKTGDRVACSYIPVCGTCRHCSTGHQNLCDAGKNAAIGCLVDGTFRFHDQDEDLGGMCVLGTFSQRAVISEWSCVKIEDDIPFELAALVSCGVTTGFCSSIYAADVRPGETVMIFGAGGVGINAVQGARYAGGKNGADLRRAGKNGLRGIARFADPDESADDSFTRILPSPRHVPSWWPAPATPRSPWWSGSSASGPAPRPRSDRSPPPSNTPSPPWRQFMIDTERTVALRSTLAADGYLLEIAEEGTRVRVTIGATPEACADCLVPKDLMRGILGQALGVPEDTIDLAYPTEANPER